MMFTGKQLRQMEGDGRLSVKKKEKQNGNSFTGELISIVYSQLFDALQNGFKKLFKSIEGIDKKIDGLSENKPKPEPKPIKQPEVTGFKIIRDMDNRIQKIEVIRSK